MSIRQVYDTTALLSISLIKKLDILRKLDIDVFVPVSVMEELSDIGKYRDELGDAAKEVIMSGTIERVELENEYKILAERIARFPRVDRGEAEALALSYQATKRGWEQSVLYETAIVMLEEAKKMNHSMV